MENNSYSVNVYVDGQHKILNVPLIDVMDDLGFIPESDYNQIFTLSVVWYDRQIWRDNGQSNLRPR